MPVRDKFCNDLQRRVNAALAGPQVFAGSRRIVIAYMSPGAVASCRAHVRSGVEDLGPFAARYTIRATQIADHVAPVRSDTPRPVWRRLHWDLDLSFVVELSAILPELSLPAASVAVPGVGHVSTPPIPVEWPSVTVRVAFSDVVSDPDQLGATSAGLLAAIALSVTRSMLDVPFGGPVLALALQQILAIVGIRGATGFLGTVITPFAQSRDVAFSRDLVDSTAESMVTGIDGAAARFSEEHELMLVAASA